jgi:FAD synthase
VERIRDEVKFENLEKLAEQLTLDKAKALSVFANR